MFTKILNLALVLIFLASPSTVFGLAMPTNGNDLANIAGISAPTYIVADADSGEILISKNPELNWTAASLTKLITAMVVLDAKVKLSKQVVLAQVDQDLGACKYGGACIKAKVGTKFTVDGLFHATLMPSANNAASALSRSTGFSMDKFVAKMNEKAISLGAVNSYFKEPTGMDPGNIITAGDFAKIVSATFSQPYLSKIAGLNKYFLRSTNNSGYNQTIQNTNKLLTDSEIQILGAKTGYLNESKYNFAALIKENGGRRLAVVVLGENNLSIAFRETKILAELAGEAKALALLQEVPTVLGIGTVVSVR